MSNNNIAASTTINTAIPASTTTINTAIPASTTISSGLWSGITASGYNNSNYTYTYNNNLQTGNITFHTPKSSLLSISDTNNKELVRMDNDGTVIWGSTMNIDEAAEAFGKTLTLGAEISAGITKRVKLEMRDSVFNDLIDIAKEKGSLTADDLSYLLKASKIVEKLKGGKE